MPSDVAIAPNGDIYIADMHHNRIRKVDAQTHVITTIAGNGTFGKEGDNGPATDASLAGPSGIALGTERGNRLTVFIADSYNGLVRVVGPDGIIRSLSDGGVVFGAPSRVAFDSRTGSLYVADSSKDQVVEVPIASTARNPFAIVPRTLVPLPGLPRKTVGE
jgi:DNA-binding beta-propeller fold protein YncE